MNHFDYSAVLGAAFLVLGLSGLANAAEPPKAERIPHKMEKHGEVRTDDYYWLRERENPEVIKYLKDENAYTAAAMKHTEKFQEKLFAEMKSRIKEDDSSVPFKYGPYFYYKRYEKGSEYPVYARKKGLTAPEEILLDVNEAAHASAYYHVRFPTIRPDHKMMAFAVDTRGRRFYTVYFKDLETGKILDGNIPDTAGNMNWANDNKTLFYVKQDTVTLRWNRILAHRLGEKEDKEIYFEKDETFEVSLSKSKSDAYIFLRTGATLSTEYRCLNAGRPEDGFKMFYPRRPKLEYSVDDGGDAFYITHNDNAKNFKVSACPPDKTDKAGWTDVIPHRDDTLVEYIDVYENWLVIKERNGGLPKLRVMNRTDKKDHYLPFDEPTYVADAGENFEYKTDWFRFNYQSLTIPESVYDYNMATGEKLLKKRLEVPGGFEPEDYVSGFLSFTARDGEKAPMSIVYKKGLNLASGANPVYVHSYGSYGYNSDPSFSSVRLSLLNRGFICAIPHIRGGSELGRRWYEEGRQLKKKNTFYDFIDATKYLIERGYTSPKHIYAEGGSAGGLLMGAVSNLAPEYYNGIIAGVPFVDILTTMLDPNIPLTTSEYDEWGNPGVREYYEYMRSYSPYDNVERKAYPNMLITAGLNDSQVQYWEPAKWTARLRAMKTDNNLLLLKTDMDVGHGGKSGRFESLHLNAFGYAFMLDLEGIKE
ncbi:MAG: S9 family peptidase [Elusimicrobia bacterium]|nr:S9 family peptidase [Elusimicrobiota bacterium]